MRIGVFDSGVGGLTVARKIFDKIEGAKVIYYGDTLRVPYGGKSKEELIFLADKVTEFLVNKEVDIIVDACNSTSVVALEHLQKKYALPILGVIDPGVRAALEATKNKKIGLIATEATVKSKGHLQKMKKIDSSIELYTNFCPAFVNFIEKGLLTDPGLAEAAENYLKPLLAAGIDTLILGCTHYPFIMELIKSIVGPEINIVDPADETVRDIERAIENFSDLGNKLAPSEPEYFVSGDDSAFYRVAKILLPGYSVNKVEKIDII